MARAGAAFDRLLRGLAGMTDAAARRPLLDWFARDHGDATAAMLRAVHAARPRLLAAAHAVVPWQKLLARYDEAAMDGQVDLLLEVARGTRFGPPHGIPAVATFAVVSASLSSLWSFSSHSSNSGAVPSAAQREAWAGLQRLLGAPLPLAVRLLERVALKEEGTALGRQVALGMDFPALLQHPASTALLVRCAKAWLWQTSRCHEFRHHLRQHLPATVGEALAKALPPRLAVQFFARADPSLLGHLDLAGLLRRADAGALLTTFFEELDKYRCARAALENLAALREGGGLWRVVLQIYGMHLRVPREPAARHALGVCLPVLMQHPQPECRMALLERLPSHAHHAPLMNVARDFQRGGVSRGLFMLQLGLIAEGCGSLLGEPRVRRLLRHRGVSHDGHRVQQLLSDMAGVGKLPAQRAAALLNSLLLQPDGPALARAMHGKPPALVAAWRRAEAAGADVLTCGAAKREVDRLYAQQVVPQVIAQLHAYAALARAAPHSPLLSRATLLPAEEVEQTLCAKLTDTDDPDPQVMAMLRSWRAPHLIYVYASKLQESPYDSELPLLRSAVRAAAGQEYAAWRRAGSEQLAEVLRRAPAFELTAWEAGAAATLPERPPWRLVDTAELEDWILGASEEAHSCQAAHGDPFYSRCLVGRIADGAKRMLAVKDAQGEVMARAMWRLMLDPSQRPTLLLGRPYAGQSLRLGEAAPLLAAWAQQRATALGLPVMHADGLYPTQGSSTRLTAASSLAVDYWDEMPSPIVAGPVVVERARALAGGP